MKTISKFLLNTAGCVFLSACANTTPPPKTKIVDTRIIDYDNGSRVTVLTLNAINGEVVEDTDNSLNVVARTENVKLIGLKTMQIAAAFFGGGEANFSGYSKEQLKGIHINSVKNKTMDYLNPELDETLKSINMYIFKDAEIKIQPYKFKLIYEDLGTNKYEFLYSATISSGDFNYTCSSSDLLSSERIQSIDNWEKDNYNLTQILAEKIIKNCFSKINEKDNKEKLKNELLKFN